MDVDVGELLKLLGAKEYELYRLRVEVASLKASLPAPESPPPAQHD